MLAAGLLRHRVTLESRNVVRDAIGGEAASSWCPRATVHAAIDSPSGREVNVAQQLTAVISRSVVIRPRKDVEASWRVRWGERVLSIEAVLQSANGDRTTLLCSEGLNQADL